MELRDYMDVLRRHLALLMSVLLFFVALAALFTIRSTPQYASSSQLFVSAAGTDGSNSAFQGSQFALQRVKSYASLNRLAVAQRVVDKLDLEQDAQSLAKEITASAVPDTVLLTVTVQDPSQRRAQQLSQTFAEELVKYVVELESAGEQKSSASVSIVGTASTSSDPVSPNALRNLLLGAAVGLVLGAAAATLRENLDSSVRSTARLEEIVDAPCLGTVVYTAGSRRKPLLQGLDPFASRPEAYRVLRTNLEFLPHAAGPKVYLVTGSTSGDGKSAVAANFAESLAEAGRSVVLLEADLRQPILGRYFSLDGQRGLSTVLRGEAEIADVIQPSGRPSLDIVTSGRVPANPAELLQSEAMNQVLASLRDRYEYVIIDSAPLQPVADATICSALADGTILVVRRGRTSSSKIALSLERLEGVGAHVVGTVLVKTRKIAIERNHNRYGPVKVAPTMVGGAATTTADAVGPVVPVIDEDAFKDVLDPAETTVSTDDSPKDPEFPSNEANDAVDGPDDEAQHQESAEPTDVLSASTDDSKPPV